MGGTVRTATKGFGTTVLTVLLALLLGCEDDADPVERAPPDQPPAAAEPTKAAAAAPDRDQEALADATYVHGAQRCGECHASALEEWRDSAHARAASSALYVAMRDHGGGDGDCARCHVPLEGKLRDADHIVAEGITCDVCHTVADVEVGDAGSSFEMRLDDNVKYGPICDAEDHYFHRMGCAPVHARAQVCASCHHHSIERDGESLPIFTEYSEWLEGPYAEEGIACQRCHMPEEDGEVATGAGQRTDEVSHHGFLGVEGDLRQRALAMRVRVSAAAERIRVKVALENRRGGHRIPTGMPGKELVLRVRALDEAGDTMAMEERVYSRQLVDSGGAEVPFPRAVRVGEDDRIAPRETRDEEMELVAADAGRLVVDVIWRAYGPALAGALSLDPAEEEVLLTTTLPFGPPARGRRAGLPARREVRP